MNIGVKKYLYRKIQFNSFMDVLSYFDKLLALKICSTLVQGDGKGV